MFISLEGTEGVGKSTLITRLATWFEQNGKTVILTREPGGTPLAEKMRQLLLNVHDETLCADSELLMMYSARAQHLAHIIQPALAEGKIVLCDRFADASFAYQGFGRGLSLEKLQLLNAHFVSIMPNLTFWLDAPIELGMARAKNRGQLDRFEQEKVEFFNQVRAGYQALYEQYPQRIKRLDASLNEEDVFQNALTYLNQAIK